MDPLGENPWWTLLVAALPALLCTILIFMDQQITAVIINRKEHKLKVRWFAGKEWLKAKFQLQPVFCLSVLSIISIVMKPSIL